MNEPTVKTKSGVVRGRNVQGVAAFKGIPHAAPPVDHRRFAAPVPPQPWDGVRDASAFSPTPPQADLSSQRFPGLDVSPIVGESWRKGDDYLKLNFWTPDPGAQGLPVMVFIYGGAFVSGGSSTPLYDGNRGGTYLYEFVWPSPACGGMRGACHGLELGFVFDTLDTPGLIGPQGLVGEDPPVELAKRIHQTSINFAVTGVPGWIPFSAQQHQVMCINTTWEILNDPRPIERHAWDGAR